jgi:hypothetical protein
MEGARFPPKLHAPMPLNCGYLAASSKYEGPPPWVMAREGMTTLARSASANAVAVIAAIAPTPAAATPGAPPPLAIVTRKRGK